MKLLNSLALAVILNVPYINDTKADEIDSEDDLSDESNLNLCFSIGDESKGLSIFEPELISCNLSNIDSLLELGTSYFSQEMVWERFLGASFSAYFLLIESTLNHELGHYSEMLANGIDGTVDLSLIPTLNGITRYPEWAEDSPSVTEVERMSISGRGMAQNTMHSQFIFRHSIFDGGFNFFTSLNYIIHHLDITNYVFSDILTGNYGLMYGNASDIVHYNGSLERNIFIPFSRDDARWPSTEFMAMRYNLDYTNFLENRFYDNNILGVAIFNLFDPCTWLTAYKIGDYIATGDNERILLNPFIPQFNGLLTSVGPLYQLIWNFPLNFPFSDSSSWVSESLLETLLSTELSIGFSPEFSFEAGIGLFEVPISTTNMYFNLGGSLSHQQDGIDFTDENETTWTYRAGVGYSSDFFNIDLNSLIKSSGWSSEMFGLNPENIFFLNIKFN